MPYTRAWTNAVLGTNPANTIDTLLANIREDVNERLTDILDIVSFTADPLVARGLKLNRTANAKIYGGTTNLSIRKADDTVDNVLITDATGDVTIRGALTSNSLSVGATTVIGLFTVRNAANSLNNLIVDDGGSIRTRSAIDTTNPGLVIGQNEKIYMEANTGIGTGTQQFVAATYYTANTAMLYKLGINNGSLISLTTWGVIPAAAAALSGVVLIDSGANRLVYYNGSNRYFLAGTSF